MQTTQRIDKWLWFARLVKSRSLAQGLVEQGSVRINRTKIARASQAVKPGDVVTIALNGRVMVVRVEAAGTRRGPATEARTLYAEFRKTSKLRG